MKKNSSPTNLPRRDAEPDADCAVAAGASPAAGVPDGFFLQVLENLPSPIFVKDETLRWVFLNRAMLDATGIPAGEMLGKSDFDVYPREEAEVFRAKDREVLATGRVASNEEDITLRGVVRRILTVKSLFADPATGRRYIVGHITDITRRRELEEVVRRAERDHRNILDSVNAMIWYLDTAGLVTRANRQAAAHCGLSVQEMLGRSVYELFPPEFARAYDRDIRAMLADGKAVLGVVEQGSCPDGSLGWFEIDKIPYLDQHGRITGLTVVATDITERRKMEEVVRRAERDHRNILDTVNALIWYLDTAGRVTRANRQAAAHCGLSVQEMLGRTVYDLFPPEFARAYERDIREVLSTRTAKLGIVEPGSYPGGGTGWYKTDKIPYLDSRGEMIGLIVMVEDITQHKRVQDELRASEERFRALVETTSDCIWEHGPDLRITYMSPQCLDILGYPPEEMLGMTPLDVTVPEETQNLSETYGPVLERREPFHGIIQHCRGRDGRIVALESSGTPVYDSAGRFLGYHGVSRDVTARETVAAALRESEERLRTLVENIPVLLHAHDESNNYVFWNRECERVLGYGAGEVLGNPGIRDRIFPEPEAQELFARWHGNIREYRDVDIPMVCRDGTRKIISWTSVSETCPLPGWGMWETGVDVTVAREVQERLRQSHGELERRVALRTAELARAEARYRSIYENAPVGIFQKTLQGRFLAANDQLALIYGYDSPEALLAEASDAPAALYVDPAAWAAMRRLLSGQDRLENFEVLVRRADGRLAWTSRMVRVVRDAEGKDVYYEGFVTDVTGRRQAEERVHALTRELLRAQESERQRISRELHDNMAQTLSSLAIAWKTMFDGHPEIPSEVRQRVEGLSAHLSGLIRSVRDLAYDLRPLALDELGLARAMRSHCEEFADQTGLDVQFSAAGLDSLDLDTDTAINIFRLVQEALRNVAKHAGARQVGVKLVASHPHLLVRVEDDGQGFDMAERRAVTRPGERRMGLQSMEERVLLLGGTFRVHSRPGQGTRIFAEIPVLERRRRE